MANHSSRGIPSFRYCRLSGSGTSYKIVLILLAASLQVPAAIDLTQATFTQVVNQVSVSDPLGNSPRQAIVNSPFAVPDVVATGANSRAELTAADSTITRVGSNTQFSFMPKGRGINLHHGSILFNSPHGKGGGIIKTACATAGVLGTTIIVSSTENGGFKLLVIEGVAKVTLLNDRSFVLHSGQLTYILPGATQVPPIFEFRLSKQIEGSNLLTGFTNPLPSESKVFAAENFQEHKIATGRSTDTGVMLGAVVNNQVQLVDTNTQQPFVLTVATGSPLGGGGGAGGLFGFNPATGVFTAPGGSVVTGQTFSNTTGTLIITSAGSINSMNNNYTGYSNAAGAGLGIAFTSPQDISLNGDTLTLVGPANGGGLTLTAANNASLTNINFVYPTASIGLNATAGNLTLSGGNLSGSTFSAMAGGTLSLNGTSLSGNSGVSILTQVGSINLTNGSLNGPLLSVFAGSANPTSSTATITSNNTNYTSANNVNIMGGFASGGAVNVNGGSFNAPGVAMSAYTVNISNVNFSGGTSLNLASHLGNFNTGSSINGDINFVTGVNYGVYTISTPGGSVLGAAQSAFPGKITAGVIP